MTTRELTDLQKTQSLVCSIMSKSETLGFQMLWNALTYLESQYLGHTYHPHHSTKSIFLPEIQDAETNHP